MWAPSVLHAVSLHYYIEKYLDQQPIKAQDILSPDCRYKKNQAHHKNKKGYSNDVLSGYAVSSLKAVRYRYILFVFMVNSAYFRLQYGLSMSWA